MGRNPYNQLPKLYEIRIRELEKTNKELKKLIKIQEDKLLYCDSSSFQDTGR